MVSVVVVELTNLSCSCEPLRSLCERDTNWETKDSSIRINFVLETRDQTQPGSLSSAGTGRREPWEWGCMQATMPKNQPTFICLRTAIMSWNKRNIDAKLKINVYLILSLMNQIFTQGLISSIDCFALPRYWSLHHMCSSTKSNTWLLTSIQTILAIKYTVVFLTLLFYSSFSFFPVHWKVYFANFGIPPPMAYPDIKRVSL